MSGCLLTLALLLQSTSGTSPAGSAAPAAVRPAGRDARWAVPLERPGLRNLHRVSPTLFRGAQPSRQGLQELRRLGVRTVVSLRAFHGERRMVEAAGLGYQRIAFEVWNQRGADRTGTAVAVYRICVEGWSREQAIDELVNGGYGLERRFVHLVRYLRSFDVEAVRPGPLSRRAPG